MMLVLFDAVVCVCVCAGVHALFVWMKSVGNRLSETERNLPVSCLLGQVKTCLEGVAITIL